MSEKIIRDPVHDVIAFRIDRPGEGLLFRLLNTIEFQRLRRIRQLGLASLAYPGADHSRYSHSLGVMETARKMLARLKAYHAISEDDETLCLVGALLHDVGHGPFSHVFERVTGVHHESVTRRVIEDPASEIHRTLAGYDPAMPARVLEFLACRPGRSFFNDILASQLDADRFDYLLRDNLMTGSRYGDFDLGWLLQALTIDETSDRLAVSAKGISAVENYLQSRYHMYRNVYFHKVVRSAEGMVKLALQRARRLAVQGRLPWPGGDHPVHRALLGQALSIDEFAELDDVSMLAAFKTWSGGPDATLAQLCHGLLYRRLYKVVDLSHIPDATLARDTYVRAENAIAQAGGDPSYDLFFDEPANTPYVTESTDAATGEPCDPGGIFVKYPDGRVADFAKTSPIVDALNRQLMFRRIHVREEWKPLVAETVNGATL